MIKRTDETDEALMLSLVGRTITRGWFFDASPDSEWQHHETCWLWLDDGRVVEFSSYGYDADGATVNEIEVMNVESCLSCKQPHPDSQIFTRESRQAEGPNRYTYCVNGNDIAWGQ